MRQANTATVAKVRPHAHKPNGADPGTERCPWCGSAISRAEFQRIKDQIAEQERARIAKVEKALNERFTTELNAAKQQAIQAECASAAKKIAEATKVAKAAEQHAKRVAAERDAVVKARVEAERGAGAKKLAEVVNAERAKGFAERLKLTEQLEDLRRRLERRDRPAGLLGEEGELDAFMLLQEKFVPEGDEIIRTKKFARGGDIEHRIVDGTGLILYEVKNHQTYQSKWTAKAKEDQLIAKADHVVIVSTAFPAGHRELLLSQDGVLVVSPARILAVATWLRTQTIRSHSLKLSNQDRQNKVGRLYRFMTGDVVAERWARMGLTVTRMHDALRAERLSHDKAWADRAGQIEIIDEIRNGFVGDLDAIFEATEGDGVS